jgi:hypothetical protein
VWLKDLLVRLFQGFYFCSSLESYWGVQVEDRVESTANQHGSSLGEPKVFRLATEWPESTVLSLIFEFFGFIGFMEFYRTPIVLVCFCASFC